MDANPANVADQADAAPDGFLDPILRDMEKEGVDAVPIARSQLERTLSGAVLPVIGINALLIALVQLAATDSRMIPLFATLVPVATVALLALVLRKGGGLGTGTLLSVLLISAAALEPTSIWPVGLVAVVAASLALGSYLDDWSGVLFAIYLVVVRLENNLLDVPHAQMLAFELLALTALIVVFARREMPRSTVTAVVAGLAFVFIEAAHHDDSVLVLLLAVGFFVVAVVYELRWQPERRSRFRDFCVQGVGVALMGLMAGLLSGWSYPVLWLWAGINAAAQALLTKRAPESLATRASWVVLVVLLALINEPLLDPLQVALLCVVAALLLHTVGLWRGQRFPSDLGVGVAVLTSTWIFIELERLPFGMPTAATGLAASAVLVFIALRPRLASGPPWWVGFLGPGHAASVRKALVAATAPFYQTGLGAVVASYVRRGYEWLKYLKGAAPLTLLDVILLAGHALGAVIIADQVSRAPWPGVSEAVIDALGPTVVWIVWGGFLVRDGLGRGWPLLKLAGFGFLFMPTLLYLPSEESPIFWSVIALSGMALWLTSQLQPETGANPPGQAQPGV